VSAPDFRTPGDVIGETRQQLAERFGAASPEQLGFKIEGEPGYTDCDPNPVFDARCGGCDRCLYLQCEHWHHGGAL
jgi:hypothetical protein